MEGHQAKEELIKKCKVVSNYSRILFRILDQIKDATDKDGIPKLEVRELTLEEFQFGSSGYEYKMERKSQIEKDESSLKKTRSDKNAI